MLSIRVLELPKLEQFRSIVSAYALLYIIVQISFIIPAACIFKALKRIVDRKEYPSISDLFHTVLQRWRREMPASCNPDIVSEVVIDRTFAIETKWLLDIFEPVIDPPKIERNMLAQVTNDDLQLWMPIEDTIRDHAKQM